MDESIATLALTNVGELPKLRPGQAQLLSQPRSRLWRPLVLHCKLFSAVGLLRSDPNVLAAAFAAATTATLAAAPLAVAAATLSLAAATLAVAAATLSLAAATLAVAAATLSLAAAPLAVAAATLSLAAAPLAVAAATLSLAAATLAIAAGAALRAALAAAAQPVAAAAQPVAAAAGAVHSRLCRDEGGEGELRRVGRVRRLLVVSQAVENLWHHALHRGD